MGWSTSIAGCCCCCCCWRGGRRRRRRMQRRPLLPRQRMWVGAVCACATTARATAGGLCGTPPSLAPLANRPANCQLAANFRLRCKGEILRRREREQEQGIGNSRYTSAHHYPHRTDRRIAAQRKNAPDNGQRHRQHGRKHKQPGMRPAGRPGVSTAAGDRGASGPWTMERAMERTSTTSGHIAAGCFRSCFCLTVDDTRPTCFV